MAMLMKLEHLVTKNGKLTFRRRIPQDLLEVVGKTFFQEPVRSQQQGVALAREHAALMDAFQASRCLFPSSQHEGLADNCRRP